MLFSENQIARLSVETECLRMESVPKVFGFPAPQ